MEDKDRIERLRKQLYSRTETEHTEPRHPFQKEGFEVQRQWEVREEKKIMPRIQQKSFLTTFFISAIVFFIASVLFGAFYFFGGRNLVSADNIDIQIQGPTSIGGGEELELQISILNKNSTTLELADLLIEYPEGTRAPNNLQSEVLRYRESLGNIAPGERVKKSVHSVLFGEENSEKKIKVTIEYRVAGSNAIFFADKEYSITLSSAPVGISVRSFNEITSGQEIDFSVVVGSNSTTPVLNLVLEAEYPFGFEFKEATPKAQYSNTIWELGDLKPEEEKTIHIVGVMTGQNNEERVFRFSVGLRDELDVKELATTFVSTTRGITIQRPFIGADLSLNDKQLGEYVFEGGEQIQGEIAWKNNLPDKVSDAYIKVHLSGSAVDESSVSSEQGFYDSVSDTITWTKDTLSDFATLDSLEHGTLRFSFKTRNVSALAIENPKIAVDVTVGGKRVTPDSVPEELNSTITRNIRLLSDFVLTSRLLRITGPFSNIGPIPPIAEKQSTYTVIWTITNVANHISGAKVTATLPPYVLWRQVVSPQGSDISFNPNDNHITWNVGEVPVGVGSNLSPKEVAFQIAFTPSLSQVGEMPILVHTQTITGFDQFTEQQISRTLPALTTQIQGESLPSGHAIVVK